MKRLQQLTREINDLTLKIEQDYPELYNYLDENPITLPHNQDIELTSKSMSEYLESLKELMLHHIETHKQK